MVLSDAILFDRGHSPGRFPAIPGTIRPGFKRLICGINRIVLICREGPVYASEDTRDGWEVSRLLRLFMLLLSSVF